MKRFRVALALFLIGAAAGAAIAGERARSWRFDMHDQESPFVRSKRSASVWASDRCWKECGSYCSWNMAGCLREDSQGHCLKLTDKCHRYCQRECRTMAGPYLPIELPWD